MKVLIIYTHPNHQSLDAEILTKVQTNLNKGHQVKLLDLYQEEFNPVLKFDQSNRRRDLKDDPEMKPYRDLVAWADELIFIFPIWWAGVPAILKGFIDRVFVQGFAYRYKGRMMEGFFKDKKAWIITTCDAPSWSRPFLIDYGRSLKLFVLKSCGFKYVRRDILYSASASERARTRFLTKIIRRTKEI